MLDMMTQAKNAIEAYNTALKATSSNIANMSVTGYKKIDVSFQSIFEKVLRGGTAASSSGGGTNPIQQGQGMTLGGVSVNFTAGECISGQGLDLAIQGQGLFVLSPDGGRSNLYTRAGSFEVNANGNLTSNGMQVYGFDNSNNLVAITGLPSGNKADYQWLADGTLEYTPDSGTTYVATGYHIALSSFPNPNGLAQAQGTTFAQTSASGDPAVPALPGGIAGTILPGQIEQSNVVYLQETITSLELQRAMSGNLTMLKMASDMISNFISKLS
jgi:flagellar hook protein FlgE